VDRNGLGTISAFLFDILELKPRILKKEVDICASPIQTTAVEGVGRRRQRKRRKERRTNVRIDMEHPF
jgi:hypothetical protein